MKVHADVLALKHADALYGVARDVVQSLSDAGIETKHRLPKPGAFRLVPTNGAIAATHVLFVGVGPHRLFKYGEIRTFGRRVLEGLSNGPKTGHVALTIHGADCGLDEEESFVSELAGLRDAIESGDFPAGLKQITVVETNEGRARKLSSLLGRLLPSPDGARRWPSRRRPVGDTTRERLRSVGYDSQSKPHVFVAMPFGFTMDSVYDFAILPATKAAGFLCERVDKETFTGDILDAIKTRIASASLVVAELSEANANVYLEVGYAWGRGCRTVLLARDVKALKFDVAAQKCLEYRNIKELRAKLRTELRRLGSPTATAKDSTQDLP